MQRTNIYLPAELADRLDERAEQEGTSRAAVIRRLLEESLDGDVADLERDLAAIDGSFGAAVDLDAPDRRDAARARHLSSLREREARPTRARRS